MSTTNSEAQASAGAESGAEGVRRHSSGREHSFTFSTDSVQELVEEYPDLIDEIPKDMTIEEFSEGLCQLMLENIEEHFYDEVRYFCLDGVPEASTYILRKRGRRIKELTAQCVLCDRDAELCRDCDDGYELRRLTK